MVGEITISHPEFAQELGIMNAGYSLDEPMDTAAGIVVEDSIPGEAGVERNKQREKRESPDLCESYACVFG